MRYLCFEEAVNESAHASIRRFLLGHMYSRHLVSSLGKKKELSILKGFAGSAPSEVRESWAFSSGLPCHKRRRSTYIEIISSGGTFYPCRQTF